LDAQVRDKWKKKKLEKEMDAFYGEIYNRKVEQEDRERTRRLATYNKYLPPEGEVRSRAMVRFSKINNKINIEASLGSAAGGKSVTKK